MTNRSQKFLSVPLALVLILLLAAGDNLGQTKTGDLTNPTDDRPLHMLVLGDSIMWGQGLRRENKFWWRVKSWLQDKTGRDVLEKIEAHSGAIIGTGVIPARRFVSDDGEVNLETPTINEQLDDAVKYYGDTSRVDLILVDGCINDVDVRNLLNASMSLEALGKEISTKCGAGMEALLERITTAFPNAHVIVTNYYRIVSEKSENNSFNRLLVKKLNSQNPESRPLTDEQMLTNLISISEEWYRMSTRQLALAVANANAELQRKSSRQKILFGEIDFAPEHAFSAPDTLLWNFKFGSTNLSGLRKAIILLSLGTAAYKANDEVRDSRSKSCKQVFDRPHAYKETEPEKQYREIKYLACRYASLGHPNKMGALVYTEVIKGQLQNLITNPGWLRNAPANEPVTAN
ncbi:MAG: SGNH/GDSL hydrolase family protein [bacterium]